jgi:hypothetical protein
MLYLIGDRQEPGGQAGLDLIAIDIYFPSQYNHPNQRRKCSDRIAPGGAFAPAPVRGHRSGRQCWATRGRGSERQRHLRQRRRSRFEGLAKAVGKRWLRGSVLYTGTEVIPFGSNLHGLPLPLLCGRC